MTTNTSILSADMIKLVIDKVYKEDYILIEAQKRSGLLSIALNGVLGSVLQNEEVKSYFKAGQYDKLHNLIQTQEESHGQKFSLPEKKKPTFIGYYENLPVKIILFLHTNTKIIVV